MCSLHFYTGLEYTRGKPGVPHFLFRRSSRQGACEGLFLVMSDLVVETFPNCPLIENKK